MIRRHLALILAMSLWAGAGMAADEKGSFAIKGVGRTKCSKFVELVKEKNKEAILQYVGWLGGFMTASNQLTGETFDLTPWQNVRTLSTWMVNFCDKNADMSFVRATAHLVVALKKERLVMSSKLVPLKGDEITIYLYAEAVRRAQAKLAELGMFSGDVNGDFGDTTRSALETFQKEKSLPVNGLLDQRTLLELFRAKS